MKIREMRARASAVMIVMRAKPEAVELRDSSSKFLGNKDMAVWIFTAKVLLSMSRYKNDRS